MSNLETLIAERKQITEDLENCEPGCYPGSAEYRRESEVMARLSAFDKAHPEVLKEIRDRKRQLRNG